MSVKISCEKVKNSILLVEILHRRDEWVVFLFLAYFTVCTPNQSQEFIDILQEQDSFLTQTEDQSQ